MIFVQHLNTDPRFPATGQIPTRRVRQYYNVRAVCKKRKKHRVYNIQVYNVPTQHNKCSPSMHHAKDPSKTKYSDLPRERPQHDPRPRSDRKQRHHARIHPGRPRARVAAPETGAPRELLHAPVPVRRRKHGLIDRRRVLDLRDRGRAERRGARRLGLGRGLVAHEHEREAGRGDPHLAGIRCLVALDGLDVELVLQTAVRLELSSEGLRGRR